MEHSSGILNLLPGPLLDYLVPVHQLDKDVPSEQESEYMVLVWWGQKPHGHLDWPADSIAVPQRESTARPTFDWTEPLARSPR